MDLDADACVCVCVCGCMCVFACECFFQLEGGCSYCWRLPVHQEREDHTTLKADEKKMLFGGGVEEM